jgi:hypothetical protein
VLKRLAARAQISAQAMAMNLSPSDADMFTEMIGELRMQVMGMHDKLTQQALQVEELMCMAKTVPPQPGQAADLPPALQQLTVPVKAPPPTPLHLNRPHQVPLQQQPVPWGLHGGWGKPAACMNPCWQKPLAQQQAGPRRWSQPDPPKHPYVTVQVAGASQWWPISTYCLVCRIVIQGDYADHMNGRKHRSKLDTYPANIWLNMMPAIVEHLEYEVIAYNDDGQQLLQQP